MKLITSAFLFSAIPLIMVSCMPPPPQQGGNNPGGTYQDPNNPYAVPGVSTRGGAYTPTAQTPYQAPAGGAPYQPIPSTPINPAATPPAYTPPASSPQTTGGGSHTVSSGDTLWGLSRKYNVSVSDIRQANNLTGDTIIPGQSLSIPR